jgi:VWFA-related protein
MSREDRESLLRLDHRVLINVVVTDSSGNPVNGLKEEDFTLLDQDRPQAINSFQMVDGKSATGRAHIVLLIDSVNNSFSDVARQRRTVDAYLRQNGGRLSFPVSLALLSDKGLQKIDSSLDGNLLAAQLHQRFSRPGRFSFNGGPSGGNQRFLLSIAALRTIAAEEREVTGRVILVWMGQGWPSLTDPGYEAATPEDKKSYFDALVQLSTTLRIAQVTIDNVSSADPSRPGDGTEQHNLLGIRRPEEAEARDLSLSTMVQLTGGRILNQERDLVVGIGQCALEANTYYRMSFDPETAKRPNELRHLEVKMDRPALLPRTYTLYYAQP